MTILTPRQQAFLNAWHSVAQSDKHLRPSAIAERVAAMPAPEYFTTFEYALRRLHDKSAHLTPRMREIRERVRLLADSSGCSDSEALDKVLDSPASSFFLNPAGALRLYYKLTHPSRLTSRS